MLQEATGNSTEYATATFKSTRIINGHSIERMPGGQLDVRIHHRFGRVNSGSIRSLGLDQANIHLGLEYGITDWQWLVLDEVLMKNIRRISQVFNIAAIAG